VLVGLSGPAAISAAAMRGTAPWAIALQWPTPSPKCTPRKSATTSEVIATGHYDHPNQTNNELTFPRVFNRALDVRTHTINEEMSSPPAHTIATGSRDDKLLPKWLIPSVVNCQVAESGRPRCRRCGEKRRGSGASIGHLAAALQGSEHPRPRGDQTTAPPGQAAVTDAGRDPQLHFRYAKQ
jgi:hypothetical protein